MSVFSGIAMFGFMGVVYGPLIMIFCSTTIEVYLTYFGPSPSDVNGCAAARGGVNGGRAAAPASA
ncbi:MAG: hypothetical protein R2854_26795 [Caldilineaceae bacterium]